MQTGPQLRSRCPMVPWSAYFRFPAALLLAGFLFLPPFALGVQPQVYVVSTDPAAWFNIFSAVGIVASAAPPESEVSSVEWHARLRKGEWLILQSDSPLGRQFGFHPTGQTVNAISVNDELHPGEDVVWEHSVNVPVFQVPPLARVFSRERWSGAPLVSGLPIGRGGILWTAVSPGPRGYERFPFLLHAADELGLAPPFRSRRLWVFFDPSYRLRADPDYLAARWRRLGVRGLHVAGWHFFEPDPFRDEYLHRLVESCHRQGVLVYLWLEFPHVSEAFWEQQPQWREKTALGQDAHLDWRKLMNLANPDCFQAVVRSARALSARFDWDGVNLAELYFESLQGHHNPSRFTPLNDDVRREFWSAAGFDPRELFDPDSRHHLSRSPEGLRKFLDYRAALAARIQHQWIEELARWRAQTPHLDLVLTHVDDRLDSSMRDAIGSDSAALLPWAHRYGFTFMVEDPATVWHRGPKRYEVLAGRYAGRDSRPASLAVDINIADRYQDVYPTKRPSGLEVLQLVHQAARSFARVALYSENSIHRRDDLWICSAGAAVTRYEPTARGLVVDSKAGFGLRWQGEALLDGKPWPAAGEETLWVPPGRHRIVPASHRIPLRLLDFSGTLLDAAVLAEGLELTYWSESRAFAILDRFPARIWWNDAPRNVPVLKSGDSWTVVLPQGRAKVRFQTDAGSSPPR
ncbi:MAG: hypothetical protein ACUVXB_14550 [Bryobacteraceae bacterium]